MLEPIEIDPKTFLRQHCALPALPEVVNQIQGEIHGGDTDMQKVAALISREPALLVQVLKVVNSAYYGLPAEITKVRAAIAYLGLNEVYRMVLSISVINTIKIEEQDELGEFWFHSFYSALCTRYLSKKHERLLSLEELWSASMLHDIGKLVCLKFFPDHYKALRSFSKEHGCLFSEAERQFSLPSSSFLSTLLCDHWRLPEQIRSACEIHTLEELYDIQGDDPSSRFKRIICVGNLLAVLSSDELDDSTKRKIAETVEAKLGCDESGFLTMMADIYSLKAEAKKFMEQLG